MLQADGCSGVRSHSEETNRRPARLLWQTRSPGRGRDRASGRESKPEGVDATAPWGVLKRTHRATGEPVGEEAESVVVPGSPQGRGFEKGPE